MSTPVIVIGDNYYAGIPLAEQHKVMRGRKKQNPASATWYTKEELEAVLTQTNIYDDKEILVLTFNVKEASEDVV